MALLDLIKARYMGEGSGVKPTRGLGLNKSYSDEQKVTEDANGVLHIPVPKFESLHLSEQDFVLLNHLTDDVNKLLNEKGQALQSRYDEAAQAGGQGEQLNDFETELKMELAQYFHEVFREHFENKKV